ncbi:MAG: MMPL family transporter [Eubacteriales bacterium]|nr:MMPL family transporter [Clostridiales bacterium]MDY5836083.1 MMPL family transporter [Eubacteriales bacterium]
MKIGDKVVRHRRAILIIALVLLVPAIVGYQNTRINYDMLTYLPEDMETVKGQNLLLDDFNKGAFSIVILEYMKSSDVEAFKQELEGLDHVSQVVSLQDVLNPSLPREMLPDPLAEKIKNPEASLMAVFFDSTTSDEKTLEAVAQIRAIGNENTHVSSLSSLVLDLKNLCEEEEAKYVAVAVVFSLIAMMLLLDSYAAPFFFLICIGMAILYNLGSNIIFGEISYITKAIAAVLQLGVTMDYSIFLWHSYIEHKDLGLDDEAAMAQAVNNTLVSITGSAITTVAGFLALCFMSYTMGKDLGLVMAKGVVLGVLSAISILPALLLQFMGLLNKTRHKSLIPDAHALAHGLTSRYVVYLVVFALLLIPAVYGYSKMNLAYDFAKMISNSQGELPAEKTQFITANEKLEENFGINTSYLVLVDDHLPGQAAKAMIQEIEDLDGIVSVLAVDKALGTSVPRDILPDDLQDSVQSGDHQIIIVNSAFKVSTDPCNAQIDQVKAITKQYDPEVAVIGEGPATLDLIRLTDKDFQVVNWISIAMVFAIILLTLGSFSLPLILVAVIEFAIIVNLGMTGFTHSELPFLVPICISTIQLGSTVDYAILMATRYKTERMSGQEKRPAIIEAAAASIPSIMVSALGFFTATLAVAIYSEVGIISRMCNLMGRGALISMATVILLLPSLLLACDKLICKTTKGLTHVYQKKA